MSIPPLSANTKSSIEIKDSCDCCYEFSCWPRKKARHIRKANANIDVRIMDVTKARMQK